MSFERFSLNYYARVGVEFGIDKDELEHITIRTGLASPWQLELTPWFARDLAKRLKKAADMIDPPKPRARKK